MVLLVNVAAGGVAHIFNLEMRGYFVEIENINIHITFNR
jgi:hypothetical protein